MSSRSVLLWAATSAGVLLVALFRLAGTGGVNYDDVFIVLVYAKHLLASGGFYWNIADGYLDGFTSLLDLLLKALAAAIHPEDRLAAAWWLNVLLYLSTPLVAMGLVAATQERIGRWSRFMLAALAALLFAGNMSLAVAAASLLEGPVFVLLTLAALWLALRPRVPIALFVVLLCLLPLARPEGAVVAVLLALWHIYTQRRMGCYRQLTPLMLFVLFMTVYTTWRINTFGYWAPNTYYAKVSENRWHEVADGLAYVGAYARTPVGALICLSVAGLPLLGLFGRWASHVSKMRFMLVACLSVVMTATVITAGGDSYQGSRFMVATVALTIVGLAFGAAGLLGRWRFIPLATMLVLLGGQAWADLRHWRVKLELAQREWPVSEKQFECDRTVARVLTPAFTGLTVAQSDYQMFKYFADEIHVIDLHGLNDRTIAHRPWTGPVRWGKSSVEEGLQRRPAVWFLGYLIGAEGAPSIAQAGMHTALTDPAIYEKAFGHSVQGKARDALIEYYRPVTMTCGEKVYNFLVDRMHVSKLRGLPVQIGTQ